MRTLGNLVLVSEELNGKLKNKTFTQKKKIMADARVPLDDTIKNAAAWGDTEITARIEALAQLLHANGI